MTRSNTNKICPYSRHSGPVGRLPAPNIFPLAKETFAKGKMFGTLMLANLAPKVLCRLANIEATAALTCILVDDARHPFFKSRIFQPKLITKSVHTFIDYP